MNGTNGAEIFTKLTKTLYKVTYAPTLSASIPLAQNLSLFLRTYQLESSSVKSSINKAAPVMSYLFSFASTSFINVYILESIHLSITFVTLKSL